MQRQNDFHYKTDAFDQNKGNMNDTDIKFM